MALPGSVLFSCTFNAARSPMAEAIMKHLYGHRVYVDSAGVRPGELIGFAVAVMDEIGIDMARHKPKTFDQIEDTSFDLVITLSPEAQHKAVDLTRTMHCEVLFWHTFDATAVHGNREAILDAFRTVRDTLWQRIVELADAPAALRR
ncbi:MAG: arsenate reductase ArsC [Alphaproteobacteria bacterium]|nr:arsenate reductase ArsC [Alphaproteobacteria bacterium]